MKKLLLLSFLLLPFAASAQMNQIYIQTQEENSTNNYPQQTLPGAEGRMYAQPIFEANPISGYTNTDGSNATFTLASGTTAMPIGSGVKIRNVAGNSDTVCKVTSVPDSTHFTITASTCNNTSVYYASSVGSGNLGGAAYYWQLDGPGMNGKGTWEIIDHGTTAGKYFLQNNDKTITASGSPCDPNLHTSTCYVSHPILSHALPRDVYFQVDPSLLPVCTFSGSIQTHNALHNSTVKFTLKFTSDQAPAKSGSQEYIVCAEGAGSGKKAVAHIIGGYEQSFKGDANQEPIFASMFGTADPYVIWSIIPDSSGNASLETFSAPAGEGLLRNGGKKPMAIFHPGTTTMGYTIKACADADPTACFTVRRYVAAQTQPAGNVDKVLQRPCEVDPIMTAAGGAVYDIGPGQSYPGFDSSSLPNWNYPWGSIFRFHGESGTPGNPIVLHNYVEFRLPNNFNTFSNNFTVPSLYVCGIPVQASGEYPWLDGANATSNVNIGPFTGGGNLITLNMISPDIPQFDVYNGNIQAGHHMGVAGINFRNNGPPYQFFPPGQTTGPEYNYGNGSAVRPFAAQNYSIAGNFFDNIPNGSISDCNAQAGWVRGCSADVAYVGNHYRAYGIYGQSTEHAVYCQDDRCAMIANLEDGSKSDQATGAFSMRETKAFYMFNRVQAKNGNTTTNGWGGDSEIQDAAGYFDLDQAFGPTPSWDGDCSDGTQPYPFCTPTSVPGASMAFGGLDTVSAFQVEHWDSLFMISNALGANVGANGGCGMGIGNTHVDVNGLENQHVLYYINNIVDCPNVEAMTGGAMFQDYRPADGQNRFDTQPLDYPSAVWMNNIDWWNDNTGTGGYRSAFGTRVTSKALFGVNIFHPGQFTPTQTNIPLAYGNDGFNASQYGLTQGVIQDMPSSSAPVEAKMGGWGSNANFLTPTLKPYNVTTLVPMSSSAAVGAATAPPFPASLYPAIYEAVDDTHTQLHRRAQVDANLFPTTIGAYDAAGGPSLSSITITPGGPLNLTYPVSVQLTATCTYTDASTTDCTASVTWSNGGSSSFSITSTGLLSAAHLMGSGTASCTLLSVNSNNVTVNVTVPPPPKVTFGAGAKIGVGSGASGVKVF